MTGPAESPTARLPWFSTCILYLLTGPGVAGVLIVVALLALGMPGMGTGDLLGLCVTGMAMSYAFGAVPAVITALFVSIASGPVRTRAPLVALSTALGALFPAVIALLGESKPEFTLAMALAGAMGGLVCGLVVARSRRK